MTAEPQAAAPVPIRDRLAVPPADRQAALAGVWDHAATTSATHGTYIALAPRPVEHVAGELAGLPFAVKDNIDVAGMATTAGSPLLRDDVAAVDATVVSVLRDAGAVLVGKTNMHELAFGITSDNTTFGPVRNPFDPDRVAGGSSGGSAATVALGTVAFSLGTDTGGSVTIPASFCAVVGFRPTTGRYPGDGLVNLSWTRDTVGMHAGTVDDVRRIDTVITRAAGRGGGRDRDAPVVGVPRSRYADVDPEVGAVAAAALDRLARAGVRLVDVAVEDDDAIAGGPGLELVLFEARRLLLARAAGAPGLPAVPEFGDLASRIASPDVRGLAEAIAAAPLDPATYERARRACWRLRRSYAAMYERTGVDAVIAPTCPVLPPHVGQRDTLELNGRDVPLFPTVIRNTAPGTVAGAPMLALPAGRSTTGLPVGMCLEAPPGEDEALLRLAARLEPVLRD